LWVKDFKGNEPRYVYYFLKTLDLKRFNSGAGVPTLNRNHLDTLVVKIHDRQNQQKIAAILSAYDDLIENNLRRIKILEEMAQTIYREWFVKFRFPDHQKVKMVNSPLGKIPEGWKIKQIGDVIETLGGGTPSTKEPSYWDNGNIDWYSPSDLTASGFMFINGSSKRITQLGLDKSSAKLFPAYSLMMTSRATIGVISINTREACTNQGFITCVPNDRLSVFYLYFWVKESRDKIISVASGATFKEISRGEFREFPITVPPAPIENTFNETVQPICRLVENLIKKNNNLVVTRDLLLPKLISGQLDVSELDITIPEANA
jgi:type I restriction enzyme S subunit